MSEPHQTPTVVFPLLLLLPIPTLLFTSLVFLKTETGKKKKKVALNEEHQ
jgi:hypothetical protein